MRVGIGKQLGRVRGVGWGAMDVAEGRRSLVHRADATATARGSARHLFWRHMSVTRGRLLAGETAAIIWRAIRAAVTYIQRT